MNLPNQLTMLRLVLTMVFVTVTALPFPWVDSAGLVLFIIASITDYLDGYIARKYGLVTTFGKLMDPLADKILMCAAFVLIACKGFIPGWAVVVILSREFLVTGLRLIATAQGAILAADSLGKLKTILQITTAIYFLLVLASQEVLLSFVQPLFSFHVLSPGILGLGLVILTVGVTVLSGWRYFWGNRALIKDA
jgi:CDP-diacylglycerol--glycerol-3-phosphate 3-phosphatidyltransferase